jgi:NAD(P)-dependent dehydrogenase (short-subunit alcohol dehydrogenase family)
MDLNLAGKTAVVTGGSKGIGLEITRTLLGEGMRVVTGSRTITPGLKATEAFAVTVDLATPEGARHLVDAALAEYGAIDLLVNNVGVGDTDDVMKGAVNGFTDLPDEAWERTFSLHFYSAVRTSRAALPSLIRQHGMIINVSSAGARLVSAGPFDYNVSKAALNALTKVIAEQYGPQGVRAVTVAPGPVRTQVWTDPDGLIGRLARIQGAEHQAFARELMTTIGASTGRLTTPAEVARLVAFLASPSNITGSEHLIDGGIIKNL